MTIREFGKVLANADANDCFAFAYLFDFSVQVVDLRHRMLVFAGDEDFVRRVYSVEDDLPILGEVGEEQYALVMSGIVLKYLNEVVNDDEMKWDYDDEERNLLAAVLYQIKGPRYEKLLIATGGIYLPEEAAKKANSDKHPNALRRWLDETELEGVEKY